MTPFPRLALSPVVLALLVVLSVSWATSVGASGSTEPESHDGRTLAASIPPTSHGPVQPGAPAGCDDAIIDDDGTVESGYGWVPSAIEGVYVQEYSSDEMSSGFLDSVCVCWLRTRDDDSLDFDVVLYRENVEQGVPEMEPYAVFPAQISGVPQGIPGATFTEVDLDGSARIAPGRVFVGVRWNPSVDPFFFACVDRTDGPGPPTRVYFRDDRAPEGEWGVSDMTNDSTFNDHRAMFIRPVVADPQPVAVPLSPAVPVALVLALLLAGALFLRRP